MLLTDRVIMTYAMKIAVIISINPFKKKPGINMPGFPIRLL